MEEQLLRNGRGTANASTWEKRRTPLRQDGLLDSRAAFAFNTQSRASQKQQPLQAGGLTAGQKLPSSLDAEFSG